METVVVVEAEASVDTAQGTSAGRIQRNSESEIRPFPAFSYVSAPATTTDGQSVTHSSGLLLGETGTMDTIGGPSPPPSAAAAATASSGKSTSPDVIPFLSVPSNAEVEMLLASQQNNNNSGNLMSAPSPPLQRGDSSGTLGANASESKKSSSRLRTTGSRKRLDQLRASNREGGVRRAADEKAATFAFPSMSLTSPPTTNLNLDHGIPFADESIGSPGGIAILPTVASNSDLSRPPAARPGASQSFPTVARSTPRNNLMEVLAALDNVNLDAYVNPAIQPWAVFCLFGSLERRVQLRDFIESFRKNVETFETFLTKVLLIDNVFPPDFNLLLFLRNPSEAPSDAFFEFPMVSWPLTTLFLVACFYVTAKRVGYDRLLLALQQGGLLTVGKGVFAALAIAESKNEEELIRNCSRHYRAAFCVGIAYQEKQQQVSDLTTKCQLKGFSMLIVNIPISTLKLLIDQVNVLDTTDEVQNTPLSQVHISRVISQRSAVVVGHPLDLMRLDILIVDFTHQTGIKIHRDFLPTPVPENSSFFNQGLRHSVVQLWLDMEYSINGSDFCIPFFSPEDGSEMGSSGDLTMEIAGTVTCVPQDLTYSLQNLRDGDVLLDFSVSSMRIGQMIAWTRRSILCLCQPSDRVEESILPSPRRSAQGSLILATLAKVAIINEILTHPNFLWEGKPPGARIVELQTSFIDLKLLIDLDTQAQILSPTQSNMELRSEMSITSFPLNVHRPSGSSLALPFESPGTSTVQSPKVSRLFGASLGVAPPLPGGVGSVIRSPLPGGAQHPRGTSSPRLVSVGSSVNRQVVNVYEVSPMIQYLELQYRCVLTRGAVEFAERLSRETKIDFPSHTLLLCPTVFHLLEYWDGLEFTLKLKERARQRRVAREACRDGPSTGGVATERSAGAASRRQVALRRAADMLYLGQALGASHHSVQRTAKPTPI